MPQWSRRRAVGRLLIAGSDRVEWAGSARTRRGETAMTSDDARVTDLRKRVAEQMPQARADLAQLVAFKSVADPRQFPAEECERAAHWVADAFAAVGLTRVGLHETPDGSKAVIASRPAPPGAPTVLLYCHYDVQPPLDDAAWRTPVWELTEKDG